jgi:hypothetical protein
VLAYSDFYHIRGLLHTNVEAAATENPATVEKSRGTSQANEAQVLQLLKLCKLQEQIELVVETKSNDVVEVERVGQAQLPEQNLNALGHSILVAKVQVCEVEPLIPETREVDPQRRWVEVRRVAVDVEAGVQKSVRIEIQIINASSSQRLGRRQADREKERV